VRGENPLEIASTAAQGVLMAKIPAPKQRGKCVEIDGLIVCPHVVYLTHTQRTVVHKMHRENIGKLRKFQNTAKAKKKSQKPKGRAA